MSSSFTHGLFWNGIFNDADQNLGFLEKAIINKSFLKNFKNPYYVYTGNSKIEMFEELFLPEETIERLNDQGLHIFLYETLCLRVNGKHNFSFYSELAVDSKDTVSSDTLDSILTFIKNNNLKSVKIYITDCNTAFLQRFYPELDIFTLDLYLLQISADLSGKPLIENNFTKKFWCGNRRYTVHRHLIMSKLVSLDGNYSWPYECDIDVLKKNCWFDDFTDQTTTSCSLLNQKDLRIDYTSPKIKVEDFYHKIPEGNITLSSELISSYADSFCAIVNESRFAQPMANLSEKTLWPLYYKMPIVLVAPPYSLHYFKSLGFKTFDRWWDESYDYILNHQDRLKKIFEVIDYIDSKSIEELKTFRKEMQEVLEHNHQTAINLKNILSNIF